jgi:uncharacterized protein (TIGR03067 family)
MRVVQGATALVVVFGWLALAIGQEQASDSDKERQSLQGVWTILLQESDGKAAPAEDFAGNTFEFKDHEIFLRERGLETAVFQFKLDATTNPKTLDLMVRDQVSYGIYELQGDELKLCFSIGGARPSAFKTAEGDTTELFTLKRGSPSDNLTWEKFQAEAEGFSIEMPGKPERRERTSDSATGPVNAIFYVTRSAADQSSYMAVTLQIPADSGAANREAALDQFGQEMLEAIATEGTVEVRSKSEVETEDYKAREMDVTLKIPDAPELGGARIRTFITHDRFFALMVVGVDDSIDPENVRRFWDSFRSPADK